MPSVDPSDLASTDVAVLRVVLRWLSEQDDECIAGLIEDIKAGIDARVERALRDRGANE